MFDLISVLCCSSGHMWSLFLISIFRKEHLVNQYEFVIGVTGHWCYDVGVTPMTQGYTNDPKCTLTL